jgi:hypothetical protein
VTSRAHERFREVYRVEAVKKAPFLREPDVDLNNTVIGKALDAALEAEREEAHGRREDWETTIQQLNEMLSEANGRVSVAQRAALALKEKVEQARAEERAARDLEWSKALGWKSDRTDGPPVTPTEVVKAAEADSAAVIQRVRQEERAPLPCGHPRACLETRDVAVLLVPGEMRRVQVCAWCESLESLVGLLRMAVEIVRANFPLLRLVAEIDAALAARGQKREG